MHFEYDGPLRIKHARLHPKTPNSCRLSVVANATNYYSGQLLFTPERVLELINQHREETGEPIANLGQESLTDEEIRYFVLHHGQGMEQAAVEGRGTMSYSLWDELVANDFLIAPDHQMLYSDPRILLKNDILYLPADLRKRLIFETEFSYLTFQELYSYYIGLVGYLEEGHLDIVLDVRQVDGIPSIILSNLASKGNDFPAAVPWHFFANYLAFDWFGPGITDISELPDELGMKELFETGNHIRAGRNFFYGVLEIYHPKNRKWQLDAILAKHGLAVVESEV